MEHLLDEPELPVASDERRFEPNGSAFTFPRGDDPCCAPELQRVGLSLDVVLAGVGVDDRGLGGVLRRVADEDAARLGRRLDAGRCVDEIARDHALTLRADGDGRLAGEHAGARLQRRVERGNGCDEVERGADGSLGVVFVRDRSAPDSHHGVADELLYGAAVALDNLPRGVEVASEQFARVLGIATFRRGREPHEVGEEDGDEAALGGLGRRRRSGGARSGAQDGPTLAAEALARLVRSTARRARVCE